MDMNEADAVLVVMAGRRDATGAVQRCLVIVQVVLNECRNAMACPDDNVAVLLLEKLVIATLLCRTMH